jgi:hypothetical protein
MSRMACLMAGMLGCGGGPPILFERVRPCGQVVSQRQQRPNADSETFLNGIMSLLKRFPRRSVIDRGIDRRRPSGSLTTTNFGPRADLKPTRGSTSPKQPMAARNNAHSRDQTINNGAIVC